MDLIKHFWYLIHVERQKETVNSISSDVADDTNEADFRTMLVVAIFRQFGRCFGLFVFQDIHNIRTLLLNIKLICTSYETDYF